LSTHFEYQLLHIIDLKQQPTDYTSINWYCFTWKFLNKLIRNKNYSLIDTITASTKKIKKSCWMTLADSYSFIFIAIVIYYIGLVYELWLLLCYCFVCAAVSIFVCCCAARAAVVSVSVALCCCVKTHTAALSFLRSHSMQ